MPPDRLDAIVDFVPLLSNASHYETKQYLCQTVSLVETTWKRLAEWEMRQFTRVVAGSAVP
jgi:hypothetical protein